MKISKFSYIGMTIGLLVASLVWLTVFSISKNPFFFVLIGSGAVLGLIIGSMYDKKGENENNKNDLQHKAINRLKSNN